MKSLLVPALFLSLVAGASAAPPNFVFILSDDQAWNGSSVRMMPDEVFSANEAYQTPHLDRLAAQGMTFSQAYSAHCKCECSRASIQMGRTTTTLNAPDKSSRNWSAPLSDSLVNTLKRAEPGYRAAHFGKWQWSHSPEAMGYDVSDGITRNEDGDTTDPADPKQTFSITRRAKTFMESQVKDGHPFYLQLSYYAVHPEAQALPSTLAKYESGGGGRGVRPLMAAMTEDLDACVGEVLKKLDELSIAENTLVIYMSDNGSRTGVLSGGKGNLGEGGIRVPLIVRGPGIKGGISSDEPVIAYDLTPTVLDFVSPGFSLPPGFEGGSWKPLLLSGGKARVERPIDRFVWHQAVEVEHPQSAIRKGDYKLLYYWDLQKGELFHLREDLSESHDLAQTKPEIASQLESELKDHVRAGLGEQVFGVLERGEGRGGPGQPGATQTAKRKGKGVPSHP